MKKPIKYDYTNKIEVHEVIDISEVTNVDSHLDSYINSVIDNYTLKLESGVLKVAEPFSRIDFTDVRIASTGAIVEADILTFTSSYVGGNTNINASYYWGDFTKKTHGTLSFIGKTTTNDWALTNNQRIIITAELGSWFNIKNDALGSIPSNTKRIKTDDLDIFGVVKAVLAYSYSQDYWILESYELAQPYSELGSFGFASFGIGVSEYEQHITVDKAGLYAVNAFFIVSEKTMGTEVYTQTSQQLHAKEGGGSYIPICMSGYFALGIGGAPYWYNKSLQGSCFLQVSPSDLTIYAKLILPNGSDRYRESGYIHANYIGN